MNTIDFNTKKLSLIPRMFVAVLFLCFTFSAYGQELIRESPTEMSDSSIIRKWVRDSIFIYNRYFKESESGSFVLQTHGEDNPEVIFFDSLRINDFEIFERSVYLCGYINVGGNNKVAIFGFFNIDQFPNSDIYYRIVDCCKEFKKIDVYKTREMQYLEENHLVMTGTSNGTRTDVLVDFTMAFNAPNYGNMYISEDSSENLDDVAVTKNYVIVSTRNEENGIPLIYYWQFSRPQLLGQDIFSMNMERIRVSSPVSKTPVFLEHSEDDKYAAVYKNSGYSQIEMTLLEAPFYVNGGITIFGSQENRSIFPQDIKYNKNSDVYDILAKDSLKNNDIVFHNMKIYHVTPYELGNMSINGEGTLFSPYNEVWSIDPSSSIYFVASGSKSIDLRLYRYKYNSWEICPIEFIYPYVVGKPEWKYVGKLNVPTYNLPFVSRVKATRHNPIEFPVVCGED